MPLREIPELVTTLYKTVDRLEYLFPGRKFTPDGHLVGSLGEVIAAHRYGLDLLANSAETHDAVAKDGTMVQIKATQAKSVALRSKPEHLIVLLLKRSGEAEEIYNGPGDRVWCQCGKMQKNGQRPITVFRLRQVAKSLSGKDRIEEYAA